MVLPLPDEKHKQSPRVLVTVLIADADNVTGVNRKVLNPHILPTIILVPLT